MKQKISILILSAITILIAYGIFGKTEQVINIGDIEAYTMVYEPDCLSPNIYNFKEGLKYGPLKLTPYIKIYIATVECTTMSADFPGESHTARYTNLYRLKPPRYNVIEKYDSTPTHYLTDDGWKTYKDFEY